MSNSLTLIHVSIVLTKNYPLECGKLKVRFFVPTFAQKITTLRISNYNNVMVSIVNKSNFATKTIFSSSYVTPSIRS